jgi:hypothetical protein
MSERAKGSCSCEAVQFELTPPSRFCAHCHCQNCRRAHGAAFVMFAGFKRDQVKLSGTEALTRFETETGTIRSFCKRCGSTLFCEGPRRGSPSRLVGYHRLASTVRWKDRGRAQASIVTGDESLQGTD